MLAEDYDVIAARDFLWKSLNDVTGEAEVRRVVVDQVRRVSHAGERRFHVQPAVAAFEDVRAQHGAPNTRACLRQGAFFAPTLLAGARIEVR